MKQNLKLLWLPFEILLTGIFCFLGAIILSFYFLLCVINELFTRGLNYGFRRNIS